MKNRFKLIIAFMLALALSGGVYAYAYTTATETVNIAEPTGDIATCNVTDNETQPDWGSILDDLSSENITRGNVPTGDLFTITPNPAYTGDLVVKVYLANTGNSIKAYQYLNMELFLEDSVEAGKTPNYRLLTMKNGVATFSLENGSGDNHTLSIIGGSYGLNLNDPLAWEEGWTVTPELYCRIEQK